MLERCCPFLFCPSCPPAPNEASMKLQMASLVSRRFIQAWAGGVCALAGVKDSSTLVKTADDDIDGVSLMSSDSEEERGITLGNAPDAQGAPIDTTCPCALIRSDCTHAMRSCMRALGVSSCRPFPPWWLYLLILYIDGYPR